MLVKVFEDTHPGALAFVTRFKSNGTDRNMSRVYGAILAANPDMDGTDKAVAAMVALILSCTLDIQFGDGDLPEEIADLRTLWGWWTTHCVKIDKDVKEVVLIGDDEALALVWRKWDALVGNYVYEAWRSAYRSAQMRYRAPREIAAPETLTPEERRDPN